MLGLHDLPMFILAGLLLAMTPGPDTAYILGRRAHSGRGTRDFLQWFSKGIAK